MGTRKAAIAAIAATNLLRDLEQAGVKVVLGSPGKLKLCGPRKALSSELVARVRAHKPELLALLAPAPPPVCGHGNALVIFTVADRGRLCGRCWRLWVQGRIDWPAPAAARKRGQS